jgi:hypothetical protein
LISIKVNVRANGLAKAKGDYPMPAEVVPVIAAIVSAFLVFMAGLGFASVWSNMDDKPKN